MSSINLNRRKFMQSTGAASVVAGAALQSPVSGKETSKGNPENIVKRLFDTLSDSQKKVVAFDWNHMDPNRGLLRTRIANNWHITKPTVNSNFFNDEQRDMIRMIYEGLLAPDWHAKFDKQQEDDTGGFGETNNIAIFGEPGSDQFEFVMTSRHLTLRADGNTTDHVAFGGPLFYGHDPHGTFNEEPDHDGNVFWEQAVAANNVYKLLDKEQRQEAEVAKTAREQAVAFRGAKGGIQGIAVKDLNDAQKAGVQKTLQSLVSMYRKSDQQEALECLQKQGGLDACHLAFYTDNDIGKDKVWDNWRLEGPAFVWHFRGAPHVHVWVNIADSPSVKLNA